MVLNFSKKSNIVSDINYDDLVSKVRNGDMSVVLKSYEQSIQSPIKSAIGGNIMYYIF